MSKRTALTEAELVKVIAALESLKKKLGSQESVGAAIGLKQPSVSALMRGAYNPTWDVGEKIALAAGFSDLATMLGRRGAIRAASEAPPEIHAPELEAAIVYHANRWSQGTIAMARDLAAKDRRRRSGADWAEVLDRFEKMLHQEIGPDDASGFRETFVPGKERPASEAPKSRIAKK